MSKVGKRLVQQAHTRRTAVSQGAGVWSIYSLEAYNRLADMAFALREFSKAIDLPDNPHATNADIRQRMCANMAWTIATELESQ